MRKSEKGNIFTFKEKIMKKNKFLNSINNLRQYIVQKTVESSNAEERTYFALTLITGVLSALVAVGFYYAVKKIKAFQCQCSFRSTETENR